MRPLLHPALCRVWRDSATVQLGVTPARAVVLGGMGRAETAVLRAMDGRHDLSALRAVAVETGGAADVADTLARTAVSAGAAIDLDVLGVDISELERPSDDPVRAPDAATVSLLDEADDGRAAMARRHGWRVDVVGAGRVGAIVARLLAAAGVGEVLVDDVALTTAADVAPGGLGSEAIGIARDRGLAALFRAEAPGSGNSVSASPHFVVLAPAGETGRDQGDHLLRAATPHLFVQVVETTGVVGPLVVPGRTSCVRCHDLWRTDRDRAWPLVLHHAALRPARMPACDVALATTVAGMAVTQVLGHLDGYEVTTLDGTLEITLPTGLPRRRSWTAHPGCGCTWDTALSADGTMAL